MGVCVWGGGGGLRERERGGWGAEKEGCDHTEGR